VADTYLSVLRSIQTKGHPQPDPADVPTGIPA
jgi:hypothetical protein